jgi:4-amino-4-deoxy-L-arabinose transferase-like glycosyltransferase
LVNLLTFVSLFLMCAAWALTTPISAGPDESGHIMKAAASARGIWTGTPTDRAGVETFVLPANVADVGEPITCTAFHPERSAACAPSLDDASAADVTVMTGVGSYNPVYYVLVGWPTLLLSGEPAVYAMRFVSALLTASLLTLTFWGARILTGGSRFVQAAVLVALTPMVYFLGGVLNPNGLETTGVAAFVVMLWMVLGQAHPPRTALIALVITTALVANLRAMSPLYLLLAAVAVITAVGWPQALRVFRSRRILLSALVAVVFVLLGALWTTQVGLQAGFIPSQGDERDSFFTAFGTTLSNSMDYGRQLIGVFGWLDTEMPDWVYALWAALLGTVVSGSLLVASGKRVAAIAISLISLAFVPALVQASSAADYGYIWQGRYSLPLFVTLLLVAGIGVALTINGAGVRAGRRAILVFGLGVTAAQLTGFIAALHRYVVGVDVDFARMFTAPDWLPPTGLAIPITMCAVGSVLLLSVLILDGGERGRMTRRPAHLA